MVHLQRPALADNRPVAGVGHVLCDLRVALIGWNIVLEELRATCNEEELTSYCFEDVSIVSVGTLAPGVVKVVLGTPCLESTSLGIHRHSLRASQRFQKFYGCEVQLVVQNCAGPPSQSLSVKTQLK
jgi:hypothetical protein